MADYQGVNAVIAANLPPELHKSFYRLLPPCTLLLFLGSSGGLPVGKFDVDKAANQTLFGPPGRVSLKSIVFFSI